MAIFQQFTGKINLYGTEFNPYILDYYFFQKTGVSVLSGGVLPRFNPRAYLSQAHTEATL